MLCYAFYAAWAKSVPEGEPCPVCVSTCPPLVCMPCGWMPCCLSNSPRNQERETATSHILYGTFVFASAHAEVCFLLSLTLDVYLFHLVDLCDGLPELLCKLPELFSAGGAEAHQLLLLWGKWAQHSDAMGVVWWETPTEKRKSFHRALDSKKSMQGFSKTYFEDIHIRILSFI